MLLLIIIPKKKLSSSILSPSRSMVAISPRAHEEVVPVVGDEYCNNVLLLCTGVTLQ